MRRAASFLRAAEQLITQSLLLIDRSTTGAGTSVGKGAGADSAFSASSSSSSSPMASSAAAVVGTLQEAVGILPHHDALSGTMGPGCGMITKDGNCTYRHNLLMNGGALTLTDTT